MRQLRSYCIALGLTGLLTACGGGGGGAVPSAPATTAFSGVAVDGYLENAMAFADCNNDGIHNNAEASATTNALGQFTLNLTAEQAKCRWVVKADAGVTKDSGETITQDFTLLTLPPSKGANTVVSPLTTKVVAAMAQNNNDLADAKAAVRLALGLGNIDVMADFVALKNSANAQAREYGEAHNLAMAITHVLQDIATQNTPLGNTLNLLNTTVKNVFTVNHLAALKNAVDRTAVLQALEQATKSTTPSQHQGISLGSLTAYFVDPVAGNQELTGSYADNTKTLSFSTSAQLNKANLLQLVSGTGSVPTLTLLSPSVGQLNTGTSHRSNITIDLTGPISLSAAFVAEFDNTTSTRLLLPAQNVEVRAQMGELMQIQTLAIPSQTIPLLAVNETQLTSVAVFNALNLITLFQGTSFLDTPVETLLASFLPKGNYTLNINLGSNSQIYTSSNQPIQIISLPIRLN
jgi:hypothetical protein